MFKSRKSVAAGLALLALTAFAAPVATVQASPENGVVNVVSLYSLDETVARIKADVEAKGIMFFALIDQSGLGNAAGNKVAPSKLLLFGNPALGTTFITANAEAGLDWPVRVLVYQSADGKVHVAYNDFDWIARRHNITSRVDQFNMATQVIQSVTSAVTKAATN